MIGDEFMGVRMRAYLLFPTLQTLDWGPEHALQVSTMFHSVIKRNSIYIYNSVVILVAGCAELSENNIYINLARKRWFMEL